MTDFFIQFRRDTAANWSSSSRVLESGEPGYDITNNELRVGDGASAWSGLTPLGGGSGGVTSVTGTGAVAGLTLTGTVTTTGNLTLGGTLSVATASVQDDAVTNAKLANMATQTIKGRTTAGTGDPEDLTASEVRGILNVADGATAYTNTLARIAAQEWAPNFTADGSVYIPADEAMTISQGNAAIGTGTLTYEKSTNASPGTFSSTTLPATLEAGAWLRVIATGVSGFRATHLVRTA
jgi:hypothetical protein